MADGDGARRSGLWILAGAAVAGLAAGRALADDPAPDAAASENFALHGQTTFVDQVHDAFRAPYSGPNSLSPDADGRETWDVTIYGGFRPWRGAEVWINPEIDQGFGLDNTLGVAGFPSGEAYKVGKATPYLRLQRLFLRQTIDLGGEVQNLDPAANQLGGHQTSNRLVITIGKFSVPDIFDASDYAHDPRHDFLNWTIIDTGTFDYAADAWGYTAGAAIEWYEGPWTLRFAAMDLSVIPNSPDLDPHFAQFQLIGEGERRWTVGGKPGSVKLTGFMTRGRMGAFDAAIALADETGTPPSTADVRRYRSRGGISLVLQQQVSADVGVFARAGVTNGALEPYEFTDVDRTVALGVSLKGRPWGRAGDTVGLAGVENGVSAIHQLYFADGGLGILAGDGRLAHPGDEHIIETYYDVPVGKYLHVALDYQFVDNPAYNQDRGPVSIVAARFHVQF
jgi:high affinity Mn2+ porin